jgi:ribosomal protein L16 Arg81 hydroxylase
VNGAAEKLLQTLDGVGVFDRYWGTDHVILRQAVDVTEFISTADIDDRLSAGLLRWPYFDLLRDGDRPSRADFTESRYVVGQTVGGFPDPVAIEKYVAEGCSIKLNQLSDWDRRTRRVVELLNARVPVATASYVFWTPPHRRGMLPHRDASHVIAVQLEGTKRWNLYVDPDKTQVSAGLDVDATRPSHEFELVPGDVLYLPQGWPHDAVAVDGSSMHLTFTLSVPTPEDFADALVGVFADRHPDLAHRFHALNPADRTHAVRSALVDDLHDFDDDAWSTATLQQMRKVNG